jgi:hypothetical protein
LAATLYTVIVTVRQPGVVLTGTIVMLPRSPAVFADPLRRVQPTVMTPNAPALSAQNGFPGMIFKLLEKETRLAL